MLVKPKALPPLALMLTKGWRFIECPTLPMQHGYEALYLSE